MALLDEAVVNITRDRFKHNKKLILGCMTVKTEQSLSRLGRNSDIAGKQVV